MLVRQMLPVAVADAQKEGTACLWEHLHSIFLAFTDMEKKSSTLLTSATTLFLHPMLRKVPAPIDASKREPQSCFDRFHEKLFDLGKLNPRLMAVVAVHFVRLWLRSPDLHSASHIVELCCYVCDLPTFELPSEIVHVDDGEASANDVFPVRFPFSAQHSPAAVRTAAHIALAHIAHECSTAPDCDSIWHRLGFKLLGLLIELKTSSKCDASSYNDDSDIFQKNIVTWQSMCLLVGVVSCESPPKLVKELHDSAVQSCLCKHSPRVRQYIDAFLIQLLTAVPRLVPLWLPSAVGQYSCQPQVASSLVIIALTVLMQLNPLDRMTHFDDLLWKMTAWCSYSSRKNQLHSIAAVSIARLVQAAESANKASLATMSETADFELQQQQQNNHSNNGWPLVSEDPRLAELSAYVRQEPESVAELAKLNPLFDRFNPTELCSHVYDKDALCSLSRSGDPDITQHTSFYESIRRAFEDGKGQAADAIDVAKATDERVVDPSAFSKVSQSASAWSAGASGDGIMYEQSLDDSLCMVLPADALGTDCREVELLCQNLSSQVVDQVNNATAQVPTVSTHAGPLVSVADQVTGLGNRPLPLLVCASHVEDGPTCGALARVSEVFGSSGLCLREAGVVKGGSFVATSVGAGLWLPIEAASTEAVGRWLDTRRECGYTVVAVEPCSAAPACARRAPNAHSQSPRSVPLASYEFPARTVLLLGDAEVGLSAQILSLADVMVHVDPAPAAWTGDGTIGRGSLQPHISGALAVWSYTRCQLLSGAAHKLHAQRGGSASESN
jgi:tRNA G18 (ribose-2'-O)-methylase SpoU